MAGSALGTHTVPADAGDDQAMTSDTELVLAAEVVAKLLQLLVLKFKQFIALRAMEVIVLRIAVVVFVYRAPVEDEFAKETRIDEFAERAINGGAADMAGLAAIGQLLHELLGVKMLMTRENMFDEGQSLLGHAHTATLEIFDEAVARGKGDGDIAKGV